MYKQALGCPAKTIELLFETSEKTCAGLLGSHGIMVTSVPSGTGREEAGVAHSDPPEDEEDKRPSERIVHV